jgi:hypothetical protein
MYRRQRVLSLGILVTTSYVHSQAYREIQEDRHPILILSGRGIVEILRRSGLRDPKAVHDWLHAKFRVRRELPE